MWSKETLPLEEGYSVLGQCQSALARGSVIGVPERSFLCYLIQIPMSRPPWADMILLWRLYIASSAAFLKHAKQAPHYAEHLAIVYLHTRLKFTTGSSRMLPWSQYQSDLPVYTTCDSRRIQILFDIWSIREKPEARSPYYKATTEGKQIL